MKPILTCTLVCLWIAAFGQNNIVWNAPAAISGSSSYGNNFPRIVIDGSGNPMTTWSNGTNMYFSKWNGTGFNTPIQLNPIGVSIAGPGWMGPDIASMGDTVYAVYKQTPETDTSSHIFCVSSFDGGITFNAPVRVDYIGSNFSRFSTVAVDGQGHPVIGFMEMTSTFTDPQWVVVRSNDFGISFGSPVLASGWSSAISEACDCCPSKIISSGNHVAMPYRDNNSNVRDTWVGISSDGGNSFPIGIPVDQQNWVTFSCPSTGPDGVIVGDTLITTYMSRASGASLVSYNKSSLTANTGTVAVALDQTSPASLTLQNFPRVDYQNGSIAFVWRQVAGGIQQLALQFTEDITTGINPTQQIVDQNNIGAVDVALFDGTIWVIWEDESTNSVWYRSGIYSGSTSVDETKSLTLSAYPNPGKTHWSITGNDINKNTQVHLVSPNGHVNRIFQTDLNNVIHIPNDQLPNGIYFAHVRTNRGSSVLKLIKY